MVTIPAKAKTRITAGLKRFQPIVRKAKDKDVNESDTVTIIADILSEVLGYDKYSEVTSEYAIRGTYCDLAIEIDGKVALLIEAKAAGLQLKDDFVKQAVDYGSNAGIDWVLLTNGVDWKVFRILFSKPVDKELVYEFDFTELSAKKQSDLEMLYYISRESISKNSNSLLNDFAAQKQVMNQFFIGQLLITDPILDTVRKQLKKIIPEAKATNEEIAEIIKTLVIKREVFEGEKSEEAKKKIQKYERAQVKAKAKSIEPKEAKEPE